MTIFPRELIRLPELFSVNFARWGSRNPGGDLHDLSDRAFVVFKALFRAKCCEIDFAASQRLELCAILNLIKRQ